MPRVLIVSPFFYPEPISTGKYNTYIAKALIQRGKFVTVCCSHPLYPNWIPTETNEGFQGMSIYRGGRLLRYPKSPMLRRLFLELWFTFHALKTIFQLRNHVDQVVAVFPPSLFVYFIRWALPRRVSLIGIVHDLQGVLGLSGAGIVKRAFSSMVKHVETCGFRTCKKLILVSAGIMRRVVDDYGIDPQKCVVHYPFVTESDVKSTSDSLVHMFQDGFKHIVYSGALGDKQNPFELLEIFQSVVIVRNDVVCHIFSGGPLFEKVKELLRPESLGRVLFHDLVAEESLSELFYRSTLHVIPQKSGTADAAFPSKLPNILAAGVPIFAITDDNSELSRLVNDSGIGKSCSTWDRDVVIPLLLEFLNHTERMLRVDNQLNVKDFVDHFFSVEKVIDEIIF